MSKYDELKDLFKRWKKAHKEPTRNGINVYDTIPHEKEKSIDQDSFSNDGLLNEHADKIEILFILKESHITNENCQADDEFWFKEVIEGKRKNGKKYYQRIKACAEVIQGEPVKWEKIAFMNINKRGGFSSTDHDTLNNYMAAYGDLIREQIEIIAPDTIVIMGAYDLFIKAEILKVKGIPNETILFKGKTKPFRYAHTDDFGSLKTKLIYMYHPAYICSNENYEKYFKEIWRKAKEY